MRVEITFLLVFALISALPAQSLDLFQRMEGCADWSCVVDLAGEQPAARLDRSLPWRLPLRNGARISGTYGDRVHPMVGTRKFHSGVDLAAPVGTSVFAAGSGWARTGQGNDLGLYVIVDHLNGFTSVYGHLASTALLEESQRAQEAESTPRFVWQGELLGRVGATGLATGPHLHWSVSFRGASLDPLVLRSWVLTRL